MSKHSWFYCIGCLVLGVIVGYFYAEARAGRAVANAYAAFEITGLGESSGHAQKAYEHESVPVAIYAMTELLDKQTAAEQVGETAFESKRMISIDLMLTHARLAKLYSEAGQTNLNAQHLAEALRYARADSNLVITNEETLMDFVAKVDKGAR